MTGNLHCLPVPTPYPVGPVNLYLIPGDEPALIDTGPATDEAWAVLNAGLAAHGLCVGDLRTVVVTHAHLDHYGLAGRIVAESGARLFTHPYNEPLLTDFHGEWERMKQFYGQVFIKAGVPLQKLMAMGKHVQRGESFASEPVATIHLINDGDRLDINGEHWDVLHTPGHALGAVCLHNRETQRLITGDHLLPEVNSNPVIEPPPRARTERPRCLVDYLASLERVAQLDVKTAYPGHGEPITAHRALIARRIAHRRRRTDQVRALLNDAGQTVYELAQQVFVQEIPPGQLFLMVSEVLGHLDILEMCGECAVSEAGGVWRYRRQPRKEVA